MRLLLCAFTLVVLVSSQSPPTFYNFSEDFIWGVSQDAYQFEGSIAKDTQGRATSAIHTWCQWYLEQPGSNYELCGDVGAGFYDHALEDASLLANFSIKHINLEIPWSRLMPDGFTFNGSAFAHYSLLIDTLIAHNVTPWVSLQVLDTPQALVRAWGGWMGRSMVDAYTTFAAQLFSRLAGRVQNYFSFHEPNSLCASYPTGGRFVGPRPNANDSSTQDPLRDHYTCVYHNMLAHGSAAAELRRVDPQATLSIISDAAWLIPNTTSPADLAASSRYLAWHLGAYFEPLVTGDWPPELRQADPQGTRIPFFTPAESAMLKGSAHYLAIDYYTTYIVAGGEFPCSPTAAITTGASPQDAFETDICVTMFCGSDPRCPPNPNPNPHMSWLRYDPRGLRSMLGWLSARYPGVPLLVAENGVGLDGGSRGDPKSSGDLAMDTHDHQKIDVLAGFWEQAWLAMTVDGVDLRGIFVWSFLDNLEWDCGYACHFGSVHVNHSRTDLQRTPKESAYWYRDVILAQGFPPPSNSSFRVAPSGSN